MSNKLVVEDLENLEWKFRQSMAFTTYHHALYRNDEMGIQMETITPKSEATGRFGKARVYYYIDGCKKEMTTLEDLCDTWNELKNFDDPDNEIIWEKKIVPKIKMK